MSTYDIRALYRVYEQWCSDTTLKGFIVTAREHADKHPSSNKGTRYFEKDLVWYFLKQPNQLQSIQDEATELLKASPVTVDQCRSFILECTFVSDSASVVLSNSLQAMECLSVLEERRRANCYTIKRLSSQLSAEDLLEFKKGMPGSAMQLDQALFQVCRDTPIYGDVELHSGSLRLNFAAVWIALGFWVSIADHCRPMERLTRIRRFLGHSVSVPSILKTHMPC